MHKCVRHALVVVFLFLLPPVLVELMDFYGSVSLLKQVKRLHVMRKDGEEGGGAGGESERERQRE